MSAIVSGCAEAAESATARSVLAAPTCRNCRASTTDRGVGRRSSRRGGRGGTTTRNVATRSFLFHYQRNWRRIRILAVADVCDRTTGSVASPIPYLSGGRDWRNSVEAKVSSSGEGFVASPVAEAANEIDQTGHELDARGRKDRTSEA